MNKLFKISKINYLAASIILILTSCLCFFILWYKVEVTIKCFVRTTNSQIQVLIDNKYWFQFQNNDKLTLKIGNKLFQTQIKKIHPQIKKGMIEFEISDELPMLKPNLIIPSTIIYEQKTLFEKLINV